MEALVLFDIDGTLLRRAGPHHRQALVEAVRRATGMETTTEGIPVQGMLDRDILTAMLVAAGASRRLIREKMAEMVAIAQAVYVRRCPDLRRKVCPGARMLLYRLARRSVPAGLVSGNLTRIGWKKMERAGLRRYLRFGTFAERAKDRAGLVRLAIRHARQEGWIGRGSPVTLIGDHPNDIRAARENGVRAIAVATGLATVEDLAAHAPDLLVPDLRAVSVEMLVSAHAPTAATKAWRAGFSAREASASISPGGTEVSRGLESALHDRRGTERVVGLGQTPERGSVRMSNSGEVAAPGYFDVRVQIT